MAKRMRPGITPWQKKARVFRWRKWALAASIMGGLLVAWLIIRPHLWQHDSEHDHYPARHGGVVVSLGEDEDHIHAEVVLDVGGTVRLFIYNEEVGRVLEVESQIVKAKVIGAVGEEELVLMPQPQDADSPGKTSHFSGRLTSVPTSEKAKIAISAIRINGKAFPLEVEVPKKAFDGKANGRFNAEREILLVPGGKYTAADINANSSTTASEKYQDFKAKHDFNPHAGEWICPVTRAKANPECSWMIDGQSYLFCCPPCIIEFVAWAKETPDKVKSPRAYVQK